ncbi:MAG: type II toxin-antitoxin system VapB family antitoxin [Propionibacteriaceae bacterium]|jgi:hypothetical protein|nr:type II toxin-antitoxin system VapB family antitoxin [Propionibacteriaceae bacterium]
MALNIKNEATVAKVRQLATRLDTSCVAAVDLAVDHALRLPVLSAEELKLARARRTAASYRAHRPAHTPLDPSDLYDENGLYA